MTLDANKQIKFLLLKEDISLTKLAELLTEKTGKNYCKSGLSRKLNAGTLRYNEALVIANLLGYKIEFIKEDK